MNPPEQAPQPQDNPQPQTSDNQYSNQPTIQPTYQPPQQPQPLPPNTPQGEDPGKGLAIAGLILAFFVSIVGLILSIIARNKSKAAGFSGGLPQIALIVNIVMIAIQITIAALILIIVMASFGGVQSQAKTTSGKAAAVTVLQKVETYHSIHRDYPNSLSQLNQDPRTALVDTTVLADERMMKEPTNPSTVVLYECGDDPNMIGYWDFSQHEEENIYAGERPPSISCSVIK